MPAQTAGNFHAAQSDQNKAVLAKCSTPLEDSLQLDSGYGMSRQERRRIVEDSCHTAPEQGSDDLNRLSEGVPDEAFMTSSTNAGPSFRLADAP